MSVAVLSIGPMTNATNPVGERDDLVALLGVRRYFLRNTLRDLDDEQLARRSTVSELCLGGLIKHVASIEDRWARFMVDGPDAFPSEQGEAAFAEHRAGFQMLASDTGESLLRNYEQVAARTDELVRTLDDLDVAHPLPPRPWFPPNTRWTRRHVILHIIAETAQHAGHADIIREAIDGAKSMG